MENKELTTTKLKDSNQALLLGLYQYNQQVAKPIFAVKLSGLGRNYPELDLFRQQLEVTKNCLYYLPYTAAKKKVLTYKSVFLAMGLLFLILGVFIYTKTSIFLTTYTLMGAFLIAKNLICGFCMMTGVASLLICKNLRPETEVINHLIRKSNRNLSQIHSRKRIEHGIKSWSLFSFGASYHKSLHLKQAHHEARDKIHDLKEETIQLFKRIYHAGHLNWPKKEHLFNQALLEMGDKLDSILLHFRQIKLTHH